MKAFAILLGLLGATGETSSRPPEPVEHFGVLKTLGFQWVLAPRGGEGYPGDYCVTVMVPGHLGRKAARLADRDVVVLAEEIELPMFDDAIHVSHNYRGMEVNRVCADPRILYARAIRAAPRKR